MQPPSTALLSLIKAGSHDVKCSMRITKVHNLGMHIYTAEILTIDTHHRVLLALRTNLFRVASLCSKCLEPLNRHGGQILSVQLLGML